MSEKEKKTPESKPVSRVDEEYYERRAEVLNTGDPTGTSSGEGKAFRVDEKEEFHKLSGRMFILTPRKQKPDYTVFGKLLKIDDEYDITVISELDPGLTLNASAYFYINFQEGPIKEVGVNGCQIEDVILVLVERLAAFQAGDFSCHENNMAIDRLKHAFNILRNRTENRVARGVEGKNET